ncbi:MAG: hypothetical protein EHM17_10970 [Verrucomicrobiaceae bacterium]|nr:MAG: hypothetical protein EHM17_10970 [Verrucomicrobiaceae bacterium]
MKRSLLIFVALLLGAAASSRAFTLDFANHELTESGHGPYSVFVPGYGEVVFENGLDGALVIESAYASTGGFELPAAHFKTESVEVAFDTGEPASPDFTTSSAEELPAAEWNAVPEAASATLGLVGMLLLALRRRHRHDSRTVAAALRTAHLSR